MKFRFRLSRVLSVRQIRENQAKLTLAVRAAARHEEERRLEVRAASLDAAWERLTAEGLYSARHLTLGAADLKAAERLYAEQEERVKGAMAAWEEARQQFLRRRAERQVLSRLKERAREEYMTVSRRAENKELDQVAAVAYVRRKGNG
ncbi:MAG: flagellar protein FliJ [Bacillota bacterium]|nr:flagellar protein FliJ [Bacillota bacterium]